MPLVAAGHTSVLAPHARHQAPLQSHPLQALVSEQLEPVHPTVVMSNAVHVYVSQAHKGELVMGAGLGTHNGYGQRGSFHVIERQMAAALELFPVFARAHLLRTWAGIVDVTPDASPIVGPVGYRTCTSTAAGGPAGSRPPRDRVMPRRPVAKEEPHAYVEPFSLDRFATGALVDEHGAAGRGPLIGSRTQSRRRAHATHQVSVVRTAKRSNSTTAARPMSPIRRIRPRCRNSSHGRTTSSFATTPRALGRTLGPQPWLPPLVQRRPRHADERGPRLVSAPARRRPSRRSR